jgi:hypothetical protein
MSRCTGTLCRASAFTFFGTEIPLKPKYFEEKIHFKAEAKEEKNGTLYQKLFDSVVKILQVMTVSPVFEK